MSVDLLKKCLAAQLALLLACPFGLIPRVSAAAAQGAQAPAVTTLDSLDIKEDRIKLGLSGPAKYNSFMTLNPPKLVIELLDTEYQLGANSVAGKGKYLLRVRSSQNQVAPYHITRVVMDLREKADYSISPEGSDISVTFSPAAGSPAKSAPVAVAAKPAPAPVAAAAPIVAASPVRAESPPDDVPAAAVVAAAPVAASAPKISVRPKAAAAKAKPAHAKPEESAPLSTEVSSELGAMAASVETTKSSHEYDAASPEQAIVPAASAPARRSSVSNALAQCFSTSQNCDIVSRLPSDLVTFDFDNTDIRDIIKLLAIKAKVNIIHGSDVSGTLTLHLTDVPFNDAFRTIMTMSGLTSSQIGENILRIMTPAALSKERGSTVGVTKLIQINYAKAEDISVAVGSIRTAEGRAGNTVVDKKNNTILVTEVPESITATERLVRQLDTKPKQVLIEAKVIEVSYNRDLAFGVAWDYFSADRGKALGKQGRTSIGSTIAPIDPTAFSFPLDVGGHLFKPGPSPFAGGTNLGTNGAALAAKNILGALTLGRITNNYLLNITLTAAAAAGKLRVLADPKIATLNNQAASIKITTAAPYVTSNATANTITQQVSFVNIGISLSVTPSINADGRITMELAPSISQPSATAVAGAAGAPQIDSREIKTTVIVKDGETVVIGGLISDRIETGSKKIPFFGDLPIIGWLFKNKFTERKRNELLIFVTPKIMPDI